MTYEEFADSRLSALLRYAVMLTGDPTSAQDLVQETMVRAQLNWRKVAASDSPDGYMRRILTNQFIDQRRGSWWRRVLLRAEPDESVTVATDHADVSAERDRMWSLLARHEADTPASGRVRTRIDVAVVRAKRRRSWQRVAVAAAVVMLAAVGVPAVADQIRREPARPVLPAARLDGPVDVLLLGSDHREGRDPALQLADTVMLLHVTADRRQAYLVILPRGGVLPSGGRLGATMRRDHVRQAGNRRAQ